MRKTLLNIAAKTVLAGALTLVVAGCANSSTNSAVKPYQLNYCLVSGDKIGDMGKPVTTVYMSREIKFCCKDCIKSFKADPAKYMDKLAQAEKKAAQ